MSGRFAVHPILVALYPVIYLAAHNAGQYAGRDVLMPAAVVLGATAALWTVLGVVLRDVRRAALVTTVAVAIFFLYGAVARVLSDVRLAGFDIGRQRYVLPLIAAMMTGGIVLALRSRRLGRTTAFANLAALIAISFPLISLVTTAITDAHTYAGAIYGNVPEIANVRTAKLAERPDIYYVILDGFTSEEILRTRFGASDAGFLDALEDRGFVIARRSHTNYAQTRLSLASSLNLVYLDDLPLPVGSASHDREPLRALIGDSRVYRMLASAGYRSVIVGSAIAPKSPAPGDLVLQSPEAIGEFSEAFLAMTPVPALIGAVNRNEEFARRVGLYRFSPAERQREERRFFFRTLGRVATLPSPKFVFAHVFAPHPPFVFDANGEPVSDRTKMSLRDGSQYYEDGGTLEAYREGYAAQVAYISRMILATVDSILARSPSPPVIIIQGDHGPGMRTDWANVERTDLRERFGILNAWLLPGGAANVPDDITPVNAFRLIFNRYLGTNLPFLEERSYFSLRDEPYRFIDVTERIRDDSGPPPGTSANAPESVIR